ncbi:hypothetical protein, partial [Pseudomonas fluorescens]|uniref:hypothetical protein n=1 Tax=Pseudomonas fluorescens TaxID=294 RepID=UPI001F1FF69C
SLLATGEIGCLQKLCRYLWPSQASQRRVCEGFGLVDQVLGGAGHVALITCQRLAAAQRSTSQLWASASEAEVVMHGEGWQLCAG